MSKSLTKAIPYPFELEYGPYMNNCALKDGCLFRLMLYLMTRFSLDKALEIRQQVSSNQTYYNIKTINQLKEFQMKASKGKAKPEPKGKFPGKMPGKGKGC